MPKNKSHYHYLKRKWTKHHKKLHDNLLAKHGEAINWAVNNTKGLALGSIGSLMLLTAPLSLTLPQPNSIMAYEQTKIDKSMFLINDLSNILPREVRPLTYSEEDTVAQTLSRHFGFRVTPELQGIRLNRSYGLIGAEQHLSRYPGDTIFTHFDSEQDSTKYYLSGIAPGLGAWRYFSNSFEEVSEKDKLREKYYIAVQTFLAPGFMENVKRYYDFFKYRKMLVVNAQNGKSLVADIADAGPAEWTGKHLGGSPEVMEYLQREDGSKKGPVLYFFIDDLDDKIPLGPISL